MKTLIKLLISLVVIIAVIAIVFVVIINLTPRKLGLADVKVGEETIEEMGFADFKLLDIYKFFKTLSKPDEDKIVKNAPTDSDKVAAENVAQGSSIIGEDGKADFGKVLEGKVLYDNEYLIEYSDKVLAHVFSVAVEDASNGSSANDAMKYISDLGATVREVSITDKKADGSANLRIILEISLGSIKSEVENALPSVVANVLPIPDKVFIASYVTMSANEDGKIQTTSQSVKINDEDNALSQAIFKVLANKAGASDADSAKDIVNEKIGEGFSYVVGNLGKVGTAETDGGNPAKVIGSVTLGSIGIENGKIIVVTHQKVTE